jgi:hypothetical protein
MTSYGQLTLHSKEVSDRKCLVSNSLGYWMLEDDHWNLSSMRSSTISEAPLPCLESHRCCILPRVML